MRTKLAAVAVIALAVLGTGCSRSDDGPTDNAASAPTTDKVSPEGPFLGECGSVTDQEVLSAFAIPELPQIWRNSVGCVWDTASTIGPSVSFSWYRGSPIGRESAGSDLIGRPPETIDVGGNPGFRGAAGNSLCEIGVQFGDDFFHWSVTYGDFPPTADPCKVAMDLSELTVARAKR